MLIFIVLRQLRRTYSGRYWIQGDLQGVHLLLVSSFVPPGLSRPPWIEVPPLHVGYRQGLRYKSKIDEFEGVKSQIIVNPAMKCPLWRVNLQVNSFYFLPLRWSLKVKRPSSSSLLIQDAQNVDNIKRTSIQSNRTEDVWTYLKPITLTSTKDGSPAKTFLNWRCKRKEN